MSSRSTSTLPAARKKPLELGEPITGMRSPPVARPRVGYLEVQCSCARRMAMAPSPTAEATRLVEPLRTSPTANMPGRLVSSSDRGVRVRPGAVGRPASGPVRTKPRSSRATSAAEPAGAGRGADEDEQRPGRDACALAGLAVGDDDGLQRLVAEQLAHLGVQQDLDVRAAARSGRSGSGTCSRSGRCSRTTRRDLRRVRGQEHAPPGRPSCRRRRSPPGRPRQSCASACDAA